MSRFVDVLVTLASVTIAALLVGAVTFSCSEARRSHHDAQAHCVSSGGSWIEAGQNNNCIRGPR